MRHLLNFMCDPINVHAVIIGYLFVVTIPALPVNIIYSNELL